METIEENFCKPTLSREISPVYLSVIPANQLYIRERFVYKEFAVQHRRLSLFNTMSIKIILFFFLFTFRRICICLIINGQKFIRRTWVIFRYFRNYSRMYLRLSYLLLTQLREIMHPRIICLFISFFPCWWILGRASLTFTLARKTIPRAKENLEEDFTKCTSSKFLLANYPKNSKFPVSFFPAKPNAGAVIFSSQWWQRGKVFERGEDKSFGWNEQKLSYPFEFSTTRFLVFNSCKNFVGGDNGHGGMPLPSPINISDNKNSRN